MKNEIIIGDIVTLKSHPLLKEKYIKGDGKLVPPIMVVKEVFYEDKKKRTHSEELGKEIADKVKFSCVFFDDNRTEFKEVFLYESMISNYPNEKDVRIESKIDKTQNEEKELNKKYLEDYIFGGIVTFKTKYFELSKQRKSKKIDERVNLKPKDKEDPVKKSETTTIQNIVNYSTPDFVLCGIKKSENKNEFYPNGEVKKVVSEILYKIKWFNSNQMKFSEVYLPAECFTNI